MKFKILLTVAYTILYIVANAQITFQKTYGRDDTYQSGISVKACFDGGYILTGYSAPDSGLLIRTNQFGEELWALTFGPKICGFDVIQTPDSNFLICGFQNIWTPYMHLVKVDAHGKIRWSALPCEYWGQAMQQTNEGNFIIAGVSLAKTDSAGSRLWCQNLDFQAMYVIQAKDSNYVMAGCGYGIHEGLMYLEKTDTTGGLLWQQTFEGRYFNYSNNILAQANDGGYLLIAQDLVDGQLVIIKTDANGDSVWTKNVAGFTGTAVIPTSDGGFAVGGYTNAGNTQIAILKFDSASSLQWQHDFGAADVNTGNSIQQTEDGGFVLTGTSTWNATGNTDVLLIKTNSFGNIHSTGLQPDPSPAAIQVFPNPFNSTAAIQWSSPLPNADIIILNIHGQVVKRIAHTDSLRVEFNRDDLPAGIYVIMLRSNHTAVGDTKIVIID